jgi:transposase-like protein
MKRTRSRYHGHRFPPEIIGYAVWVYHRFCLSFRDVEDLLAERGFILSYEAIRHASYSQRAESKLTSTSRAAPDPGARKFLQRPL